MTAIDNPAFSLDAPFNISQAWARQQSDFLSSAPLKGRRSGTVGQTSSLDPLVEHAAKIAARNQARQTANAQIASRIHELQFDAVLRNEPVSTSSLTDLQKFLSILSFTKRPSIFLQDNGNFRILWKNEIKEQVGLQFLGNGVIQFVTFSQRRRPDMMSRVAGIDTFAGISQKISEFKHLFG